MVFLVWLIWLTRTSITLFWIMDVLNMPFMEMFDTTYGTKPRKILSTPFPDGNFKIRFVGGEVI